MRTKSFSAFSISELQNEMEAAMADGFQPTIAIAFSSIQLDIPTISTAFNQYDIDLIGCSSAGEIHSEEITEHGVAVMLLDMKKDHYRIKTAETKDKGTFNISKEIGQYAKSCFDNPALIVLSGGMTTDGEKVVYGLKDGIGQECPIFGGLAGDDLQTTETWVITNNWTSNDGLATLIIDNDKISVEGMATSGWEAIGTINTITKSIGNVVYQINEEPALDVFINYFGFFDNANETGSQLSTISGQYPLQILRDGGYTILRSPIVGNQEDRSLVLAGAVSEGDQFRFSISPGFEVIDQTIQEFNFLKNSSPNADAALLFSCKGRHAALGPLVEDEIKGIYNYWKAPLIGFFCYGEIGNVKNGTSELHNETCALVVFKEK